MDEEEVLGFPGGPPHPPYGKPLRPGPAASDEPFAGLPDEPPAEGQRPKPKSKKRKRKRKRSGDKPSERGESKDDKKKRPWWRSRAAFFALITLVAIAARTCGEGGGQSSALLLGGADRFERVPKGLCGTGLVVELPPEKEMPSAGPPKRPDIVQGEGVGETLWATRMEGIIEPYGLKGRFWADSGETVTFQHPDVALVHRVTGRPGDQANHFIALDYSSGAVAWQELMLGAVLGSTDTHVWLGANAEKRSTIVAAVEMATGTITDCFAAHSSVKDGPPPIFDSPGGQALITGNPIASETALFLRPEGFGGPIQRLESRVEPVSLPIPTGRSLWMMETAAGDNITIAALDTDSAQGALQAWSAEDLDYVWGTRKVGRRVESSASTPETTVVHERTKENLTTRAVGLDHATGDVLWEYKNYRGLSSAEAGLYVYETSAVFSAYNLLDNKLWTVLMSETDFVEMKDYYLTFAADERIALVRPPAPQRQDTVGKLMVLPEREELATIEKVASIVGFNEDTLIVEMTFQGEPWLFGVKLAPPEDKAGGGGGKGDKGDGEKDKKRGGGGGGGEKDSGGGGGGGGGEKDSGGGGGGGGGGQGGGDDGEGPPST